MVLCHKMASLLIFHVMADGRTDGIFFEVLRAANVDGSAILKDQSKEDSNAKRNGEVV